MQASLKSVGSHVNTDVAMVRFINISGERIKLLEERGKSLRLEREDSTKLYDQIQTLIESNSDAIPKPLIAFITFQTINGYHAAIKNFASSESL